MVGRDDARQKVTSRALSRVMRGDVDFLYIDEMTPAEPQQETPPNESSEPAV